MYSILIQNQKTMESFQRFHPLFLEPLNNGQIGVCQWFEAGTTIETAVPELYELIEDKDEWRAIIVRFLDEEPMSAFETVPDNPFDFLENMSDDTRMRESNIPLIRLTHMLGGMPSPNVRFEAKLIKEPNKAPRTVYSPTVSEEDQREYQRLSEKYRLDGPPPSEIILVSLLERRDRRVENVSKVWVQNIEINSSEFWKRNGYPSLCRFAFCELQHQGPVQRTADLFSAWIAVLMLSLNDIDPSTLQAYKLHRISVEFDRKAMKAAMQETAGRALSARVFIQKSIQRELEQKINEKTVLPIYRLEAPVLLELPLNKDFLPKDKRFKLVSRSVAADTQAWNEMDAAAQKALNDAEIQAVRALDRTAGRMRGYTVFHQEEIFPLDVYQQEDLDSELSVLNKSIYEQRAALPVGRSEERGKMNELSRSIGEKLKRRITFRRTRLIALVCLAVFLLCMVPGAVFCFTRSFGTPDRVLLAAGGGVVLLFAAMLVHLLLFRHRLREDVFEYNKNASAAMVRIGADSEQYSRYMGSIASYMHGQSYFSGLRHKVFLQDEAQYYKRNHISALNAFLVDLRDWSVAFHLPVSFETADVQEYLVVDTDIAPYLNPLYTFPSDDNHTAYVNTTGDTILAPFPFIERLIIEREELYDDAT